MSDELEQLSQRCGELLLAKGWTISTAESCTGGWIAQSLTSVSGSSQWFETGFVTYSNEAKQRLLNVPSRFFTGDNAPGAVSEEVVLAMAEGALLAAGANVSVVTSGVAGPAGGSPEKPVGTVWIAWAYRRETNAKPQLKASLFHFAGDRKSIRKQSVIEGLSGVLELLELP
ncbi:MAG: CinA family protein [Pseudohongiellaceae bacterium]|nr:CinA family protein [Pseudohongiellaceae bacterium]